MHLDKQRVVATSESRLRNAVQQSAVGAAAVFVEPPIGYRPSAREREEKEREGVGRALQLTDDRLSASAAVYQSFTRGRWRCATNRWSTSSDHSKRVRQSASAGQIASRPRFRPYDGPIDPISALADKGGDWPLPPLLVSRASQMR